MCLIGLEKDKDNRKAEKFSLTNSGRTKNIVSQAIMNCFPAAPESKKQLKVKTDNGINSMSLLSCTINPQHI